MSVKFGATTSRRERIAPLACAIAYRLVDQVGAVSEGVADDLARYLHFPRRRVRVLRNPVDYAEVRRRAAEPASHPWLDADAPSSWPSAGSPRRRTSRRWCVRSPTCPASRLLVLGEGEERPALDGSRGSRSASADRVDLHGFVANPYPFFAKADVIAMSSRWEGLPTVLLEALPVRRADRLHRLPVRARGDPRRWPVRHAWSPSGDPRALAAALADAIDGACRRPGRGLGALRPPGRDLRLRAGGDGPGAPYGASDEQPRSPTSSASGPSRPAPPSSTACCAATRELSFPRFLKEAEYFTAHHDRGPDWYAGLFDPPDGRLRGEISPQYMADPHAPQRVLEANPEARILANLRDPVARTVSQYRHWVQETGYAQDFATFLGEHPNAVQRSEYHRVLVPWIERFGRERLHVVVFEDLVAAPVPSVQRVLRFLGVDDTYVPADPDTPVNVTFAPRFPRAYALAKRAGNRLRAGSGARLVHLAKRAGLDRALPGGAPRGRAGASHHRHRRRPGRTSPTGCARTWRRCRTLLGRDLTAQWLDRSWAVAVGPAPMPPAGRCPAARSTSAFHPSSASANFETPPVTWTSPGTVGPRSTCGSTPTASPMTRIVSLTVTDSVPQVL